MNAWLWAGAASMLVLIPCAIRAVRGGTFDRLLGMQLGGTVTALTLVMLGQGFDRSIYYDLALVFGVLSTVGSLVFARFLERWV
jgi:multicomponent Na+:H+ antiporter subunit F